MQKGIEMAVVEDDGKRWGEDRDDGQRTRDGMDDGLGRVEPERTLVGGYGELVGLIVR